MLAAYRRDEWTTADLAALSGHLQACVSCRQFQAAYRLVGEQIRQLPSIAPPANLRSRVFAAVRQEERRVAPAILRLSREATNPSLPVVRARPALRQTPRRVLAPRFALAAAAMLAIAFAGAHFVPQLAAGGLSGGAANLNGASHTIHSVSGASAGYAVGVQVATTISVAP
ncbi:MAG: hypothetical protein ACHQ4H_03140 [Ktedonobacterales bacterium]